MSMLAGKTIDYFHWPEPSARQQAQNTKSCGAYALVAAVEAITGKPSDVPPWEIWRWMKKMELTTVGGVNMPALAAALDAHWPDLWSNAAQWDNGLYQPASWQEYLVRTSPFLILTGSHWRTVTGYRRIKRILWLGEALMLRIHDPLRGRETWEPAHKINPTLVLQIRPR